MKKKLFNGVRVLLVVGIILAAFYGYMQLYGLHMRSFPQHYTNSAVTHLLPVAAMLVFLPLLLMAWVMIGRKLGYRLHWMQLLFLEVCRAGKVKLRFTGRIRLGMLMLPPCTDGTSPYRLYLLAPTLILLGTAVLLALLAALLWETAALYSLISLAFACVGVGCAKLLPIKNSDNLGLYFDIRRSPEMHRAWECCAYIGAAMEAGTRLASMPDDWFISEPPAQADNIYMQVHIINSASRLIQQEQFAKAYPLLQPLLNLQIAPDTHQSIACAILNGAICEALAELPPRCLGQLDHPSVQYMTPPSWQGRVLTVKYARALFLNHDAQEAAALLSQCEERLKTDDRDANIIRLLREKAEQA